jgi:FtsZ-interacting cell division protein ZipA
MAALDARTIVILAVLIVALIVIAWAIARKRRTKALRQRFGPEYERTVREQGPAKAETVLLERKQRVEKFSIRPLGAAERERFISEWRSVQSRFVDDPKSAVMEADKLVIHVMQARGYPMSDFEQRAADISVDHPQVVDNYRAAHEIALRHRRGEATTEDLRNAMLYYRSLFEDLLQTESVNEKREVA